MYYNYTQEKSICNIHTRKLQKTIPTHKFRSDLCFNSHVNYGTLAKEHDLKYNVCLFLVRTLSQN